MPRIEVADAKIETGAKHSADAWGAILDDFDFEVPEIVFSDDVGPFCNGDLANVHRGSFNGRAVAVKVARDEGNDDIFNHEAEVLRVLYPEGTPDEKFYRLLPRLIFTARHDGRPVHVFPWHEGYITFEAILRAYPSGIDFRDVVWMFKRLLMAIGFAHEKREIVHGAILPPHVMVHPVEHGAKIVDWSYAVLEVGAKRNRVRAMSERYRAFYAPEILNRQSPTAATDIFMAGKCAIALLGGDVRTNDLPATVPVEIASFFRSCVEEQPSRRPQNAWDLHVTFDKLLERLVGKPSYRLFVMP